MTLPFCLGRTFKLCLLKLCSQVNLLLCHCYITKSMKNHPQISPFFNYVRLPLVKFNMNNKPLERKWTFTESSLLQHTVTGVLPGNNHKFKYLVSQSFLSLTHKVRNRSHALNQTIASFQFIIQNLTFAENVTQHRNHFHHLSIWREIRNNFFGFWNPIVFGLNS